MSDLEHRRLIENYYEHFIADHDVAMADQLCASSLLYRSPVAMAHDVEGFKRIMGELFRAFPDIRYDVDFIFAADSRAMSRLTIRGTFSRSYMDARPTRRKMAVPAVKLFRFSDGRINEIETFFDSRVMTEQLGRPLPESRI